MSRGLSEYLVVDFFVEIDNFTLRVGVDGVEESLVGFCVVEELALRRNDRDCFAWIEDGGGSGVGVGFFGEDFSELSAFLGIGSEKSDLGIVNVDGAVFVFCGKSLAFSVVRHVEASRCDDGGNFGFCHGIHAVRTGG